MSAASEPTPSAGPNPPLRSSPWQEAQNTPYTCWPVASGGRPPPEQAAVRHANTIKVTNIFTMCEPTSGTWESRNAVSPPKGVLHAPHPDWNHYGLSLIHI